MSAAFEARIADGRLVMQDGGWRLVCAADDLTKWRKFYRGLWSRGAKEKGGPGPWAAFYAHPLAVLDGLAGVGA